MGQQSNITNATAIGLRMLQNTRFGAAVETLGADKTMVNLDKTVQVLDPGGAGRTVTLPAEATATGLFFILVNAADAAEALTVEDDASGAVASVGQNEIGFVVCDGTSWHGVSWVA